ncbi:hypothetical protein FBR4_2488 [Lactiplantibacillus plantarum]|uniref:hypothetical protein n=1 Tax=Lactiplantibacillus plantarum TaxID=1590 RepID=UPI0007AB9EC3|nr:hypothetical protein [Lactiplantibacillus plantarum]KZD92871.1 hypothetical protein FBR4_2488 [Lactiplantibacillus plantarum]
MSKSEVIQNLLDELNNQNQIYIAIIGTILAVLGLAFTIFSFMQRRFSDKQIQKMEDDFKHDFKQDFKIEENNEVLRDMRATLAEVHKSEKLLKQEIITATDLNFENSSFLLSQVDGDTHTLELNNMLINFNTTFDKAISTHKLNLSTLQHVIVNLINCLQRIRRYRIRYDEEAYDIISSLFDKLSSQSIISIQKNSDMNRYFTQHSLLECLKSLKSELKECDKYMNNELEDYDID